MSYQIQQYIAAAIESVLANGQSYVATANIQKNRDSTTSTVPRYEIEVGNVVRASPQMVSVTAGSAGWVYSHYAADAVVSLITQRDSGVSHSAAVARTRYLFSQEAQAFVSPVVTAFEVVSLEPTAEAQDVAEDAREDWSKLSFRFEIGLLPGAYVVPTAGP
jgi:hypothetical protein